MSHIEYKERLCPMSLYFLSPCRMSLNTKSHVEFKKRLCHPVDFRGQYPEWWLSDSRTRPIVVGDERQEVFTRLQV